MDIIELDVLEESLSENVAHIRHALGESRVNTAEMIGLLLHFEARIEKLEEAMEPVRSLTENLSIAHANISLTLDELKAIHAHFGANNKYYDVLKNEKLIYAESEDRSLYLNAIRRVTESISFLSAHPQMKSSKGAKENLSELSDFAVGSLRKVYEEQLQLLGVTAEDYRAVSLLDNSSTQKPLESLKSKISRIQNCDLTKLHQIASMLNCCGDAEAVFSIYQKQRSEIVYDFIAYLAKQVCDSKVDRTGDAIEIDKVEGNRVDGTPTDSAYSMPSPDKAIEEIDQDFGTSIGLKKSESFFKRKESASLSIETESVGSKNDTKAKHRFFGLRKKFRGKDKVNSTSDKSSSKNNRSQGAKENSLPSKKGSERNSCYESAAADVFLSDIAAFRSRVANISKRRVEKSRGEVSGILNATLCALKLEREFAEKLFNPIYFNKGIFLSAMAEPMRLLTTLASTTSMKTTFSSYSTESKVFVFLDILEDIAGVQVEMISLLSPTHRDSRNGQTPVCSEYDTNSLAGAAYEAISDSLNAFLASWQQYFVELLRAWCRLFSDNLTRMFPTSCTIDQSSMEIVAFFVKLSARKEVLCKHLEACKDMSDGFQLSTESPSNYFHAFSSFAFKDLFGFLEEEASKTGSRGALFATNNLHYILKSIKCDENVATALSGSWVLDQCETQLEKYKNLFVRSCWDQLVQLVTESQKRMSLSDAAKEIGADCEAIRQCVAETFVFNARLEVPDSELREELTLKVADEFKEKAADKYCSWYDALPKTSRKPVYSSAAILRMVQNYFQASMGISEPVLPLPDGQEQ